MAAIREALEFRGEDFIWLDPPSSLGPVTVLVVREARDLFEHTERVKAWTRSVWKAWEPHHDTIHRWASL